MQPDLLVTGPYPAWDMDEHHASGTTETRKAMGRLVRDNLQAHFAGAALLTPVT